MDRKRKSPPMFRRKGAAIAFFVVCLALLVVGVYLGIGMLTRYDYADALPEDAELRVNLAVEGYVAPTPEPTPIPVVTPSPLPTPVPTPLATPLPLEMYSMQNPRIVMPKDATLPGEAQLTSMKVSQGDENRSVVVTGWAYLDGYDAQKSTVYLVVSSKRGAQHKFYEANKLPGSTGVVHPSSRGENLERADFQAAFKLGTYEEGPYRLGALVVNNVSKKQSVKGYFPFDESYQFYVKGNAVTSVG